MTRPDSTPLRAGEILRLWWPLGASWMLMGLELPLFSAAVARMPDAEVHLAAHGGIVFPIALVIEGTLPRKTARTSQLLSCILGVLGGARLIPSR